MTYTTQLCSGSLMILLWSSDGGVYEHSTSRIARHGLVAESSASENYGEDLPEGVMSEEEKKELYKEAYSESKRKIQTQTEPTKSFNLHGISRTIYENARGDFVLTHQQFNLEFERLCRLSSEEWLAFYQIDREVEGYYWEGGWVLVNLSKQQYVKSMVASSILPWMNATYAHCFGQLILSRICWSIYDSCGIHFEGPLHRGLWAGDRFRIVTLGVFETRTSGEEWKDVSVEAAEWLKKLLSDNDQ